MVEVSLNGPQYRHLARVPSSLLVGGESASLYKGRRCTRGDIIPLPITGSFSIPSAHRAAIKLVRTMAFSQGWNVRARGDSHAFLQSENLRREID